MAEAAHPIDRSSTPMVTRRGRALARGVAIVVTLVVGCGALAVAAPSDPPKKVGTERIVVDPKPVTPAPGNAAAEEIHKGEEGLPPAVARMRKRLLDAAYSGDLARLKIVMQSNEMPPVFSVNEIGDPIEHLKSQSGDGEGLELLAILTDVLESAWVRIKPGTPQEMYVWPAFVALPLDKLTPDQMVEIYKIVTSSDFEEMKGAGKYTFYSVGIGPDGTWHWFKPAD